MFTQRPNRPFSLDALNRTLLIGGFAASLLARFFADRSLGNYIFLGISTASLIFASFGWEPPAAGAGEFEVFDPGYGGANLLPESV